MLSKWNSQPTEIRFSVGYEFAHGHIVGAINVPHGQIAHARLDQYPAGTVYVTYSDVPHCNAAVRAAIRVAQLGLPVKIMQGGITGWMEEAFPVEELRSEID
jgi:rhodanese-related sulfurtransferase